MADWYGHSRSNYFKVKDVEQFKELCSIWNVELISDAKSVITKRCQACNNVPDKKCSNYVKRVVGECKGRKRKQMLYGFLGSDDYGNLPNFREEEDEKTGKTTEYDLDDFFKDLAAVLEDDWVAVMFEVGAEKLRYVTGVAFAINSKGEKKVVDIQDIFDDIEKLGENYTPVEY